MRGVMNLRGTVVPVVDLAARLGLELTQVSRRTCLIIVEMDAEGERVVIAVMVDGVSRVVDVLDHTYLNETIAIPSAENIAIWAWDRIQGAGLPLFEVQVFETPGCFVVYRGEGAASS